MRDMPQTIEGRLEKCLSFVKINNNHVECSKKVINELTCILIDSCSTEIESAIQRFVKLNWGLSIFLAFYYAHVLPPSQPQVFKYRLHVLAVTTLICNIDYVQLSMLLYSSRDLKLYVLASSKSV